MKPFFWENVRLILVRTLGNFLVITSLVMMAKTFLPALYQELNYGLRQVRKVETKVAVAQPSLNSSSTPLPSPTKANPFAQLLGQFSQKTEVIKPVNSEFTIVIPKIGANAPVIANVDSDNYDAYVKVLKVGVAHAQGTAFPGDKAHIYLFAHSTDNFLSVGTYNAVFYLLYKLEPGDQVLIFYQNKKHAYQVTDKRVVNPDEIHYLTRASAEEFLTLQTCWPPGTTLQRLLVFASPVVK